MCPYNVKFFRHWMNVKIKNGLNSLKTALHSWRYSEFLSELVTSDEWICCINCVVKKQITRVWPVLRQNEPNWVLMKSTGVLHGLPSQKIVYLSLLLQNGECFWEELPKCASSLCSFMLRIATRMLYTSARRFCSDQFKPGYSIFEKPASKNRIGRAELVALPTRYYNLTLAYFCEALSNTRCNVHHRRKRRAEIRVRTEICWLTQEILNSIWDNIKLWHDSIMKVHGGHVEMIMDLKHFYV